MEENKVSVWLQKSELFFCFQNEKNENNIENMIGNAYLNHIFGNIPGIELLGNSFNFLAFMNATLSNLKMVKKYTWLLLLLFYF